MITRICILLVRPASSPAERVTVTMPADLVASIDRQSSHQRRRRLALLASLQAPHHNSPTNAAVGIEDWELRSNLTAYDALYVALADRLGATLLTADARAARAPDLQCSVEVMAP